jgi:4-amino-4-deoxy-L-arabinose transferase-like glycosyltransferase
VIQIKRLFWISLAIKLFLAAIIPVSSDEAYYWVWSRHPQLSYYDHPPFVAWLFWLGEHVRFLDGMVRWPGVLLAHGTLAIWLWLLKSYLSDEQRRIWLFLALLSPLMGGSGLIVTPDLPLMFFYAAALCLFFHWQNNPTRLMALFLGLAVGLGFSSKYMMALFVLSLLPFVGISPGLRRTFLRQTPILLIGAVVGAMPVWLWNLVNDFVSLKFQTAHGLGQKDWKPSWTLEYIAAQIGILFPVVVYWALKSGRRLPPVFHFLAWTPLIFFLLTTSRGYVEANWPIVAYPPVFALAASAYPRNVKGLRFTLCLWGMAITMLAIVIIAKPKWSETTKVREFHRFDRVVDVSRGYSPLFARSYQMASTLYFSQRRPVYKLKGMNRRDFFDYLAESEPNRGVYYLVVEKTDHLPADYAAKGHLVTKTIPVDDLHEIWEIRSP